MTSIGSYFRTRASIFGYYFEWLNNQFLFNCVLFLLRLKQVEEDLTNKHLFIWSCSQTYERNVGLSHIGCGRGW